jgi:hypothetical protein
MVGADAGFGALLGSVDAIRRAFAQTSLSRR